jgi:hypothetical protein
MTELLFEKFWLMLGLGIIASGSVIAWAYQRRTTKLIRAAKIVPIAFAVLLALNWWVITDREAIRTQIDKLVAACEQGDADAMGKLLDKQFSAQGLTRADLVTDVKQVFENLHIANVWLRDVQIDVERQTPIVKMATSASIVSHSNNNYGSVLSDWELEFVKREEKGWLIYNLRPLSVMLRPVDDIREVIRSARWVN